MGEEFQGGVCGGWNNNSSRNLFIAASSSPCSSEVWPPANHNPIFMDSKTASSDDSTSDGSSSIVLHEGAQYYPSTGNMSIASALQIMGINLSSNHQDSNPDFLRNDSGRSEENYSHMLLAASTGLNSTTNYERKTADFCPQIDKNWSSTTSFCQDYSSRQVNQSFGPCIEQQQPSSNMFSTSLPLNLASYSYASSLLQNLFDIDSEPQQPLLHNNNNQASNYVTKPSTLHNYKQQQQQPAANDQLQFWNAMSAASGDIDINSPNFVPSTQTQFLPASVTSSAKRPNSHTLSEQSKKSDSVAKKASNEPVMKRARIQTPSPLPTFKVRKEKMGDRITALQQLVSPFGKTDTASVLHEAIEYIKFLHDQVSVLSAPYLKNGSSPLQRQQADNRNKDEERLTQDLKSRGLCLVPISSTFPVAAETSNDFWTPTFGGSFR